MTIQKKEKNQKAILKSYPAGVMAKNEQEILYMNLVIIILFSKPNDIVR